MPRYRSIEGLDGIGASESVQRPSVPQARRCSHARAPEGRRMEPPKELRPAAVTLVVVFATYARQSPWLLPAHFSDKCSSYCERTVGDRQWKCRQTARGRSEHDLRTFPGIKFGVVARTFQNVLVAYVRLHPLGDGTSGVRANQRIGDDAVGRSGSRRVARPGQALRGQSR